MIKRSALNRSVVVTCLASLVLTHAYGQDASKKSKSAVKKVKKTETPSSGNANEIVGKETSHKEAYKNVKIAEEHLNIKVTPAEKRGKPGYVLVELYNNSDFNLDVVRFNIDFESDSYLKFSAEMTFDNMTPRFSSIQEQKIPGNGKMPVVTKVTVSRLELFARDSKGTKEIKLPVKTEVIKL